MLIGLSVKQLFSIELSPYTCFLFSYISHCFSLSLSLSLSLNIMMQCSLLPVRFSSGHIRRIYRFNAIFSVLLHCEPPVFLLFSFCFLIVRARPSDHQSLFLVFIFFLYHSFLLSIFSPSLSLFLCSSLCPSLSRNSLPTLPRQRMQSNQRTGLSVVPYHWRLRVRCRWYHCYWGTCRKEQFEVLCLHQVMLPYFIHAHRYTHRYISFSTHL